VSGSVVVAKLSHLVNLGWFERKPCCYNPYPVESDGIICYVWVKWFPFIPQPGLCFFPFKKVSPSWKCYSIVRTMIWDMAMVLTTLLLRIIFYTQYAPQRILYSTTFCLQMFTHYLVLLLTCRVKSWGEKERERESKAFCIFVVSFVRLERVVLSRILCHCNFSNKLICTRIVVLLFVWETCDCAWSPCSLPIRPFEVVIPTRSLSIA